MVLLWGSILGGCATGSSDPDAAARFAVSHGLQETLVMGTRFQHRVYSRGDFTSARRIHVYLEGDGLPWSSRWRIASDPSPRDPMALRLMAVDPSPSLYIGRPCYHGLSRAPGCSPWLWTHGRYSADVVASMTAAIESALLPAAHRRMTLIGYSGGGVLAVLIAEQLQAVDIVPPALIQTADALVLSIWWHLDVRISRLGTICRDSA